MPKTDMISGKVNTMWLRADRPGTYRGHCAEYCGPQHGNMAFHVVARSKAEFDAWLARLVLPPVAGLVALVLARALRGTDGGFTDRTAADLRRAYRSATTTASPEAEAWTEAVAIRGAARTGFPAVSLRTSKDVHSGQWKEWRVRGLLTATEEAWRTRCR